MTYKERKERVKQQAIDWQLAFQDKNYSYNEIAIVQFHFWKLARQYGLTREFQENGIL